jgi:glyoxylase-like metal-dependent hydrolase (beta-lactamase superfamily II)
LAAGEARAMKEVQPGIFHWTAFHEGIGLDVSSYYVEPSAALIDPMTPPGEGLDWFAGRASPERILLTNRHHYRHSGRFVDRFGCRVLCHESGLHEFEPGQDVEGFAFGQEVAPGITALEVGAICPDDSALEIALGDGLLAFADGLIHYGAGTLSFVPDGLIGDDRAAVKEGLVSAFRRLLERDFDGLLFAHGEPVARGGKKALRAFVEAEG